MKTRFTLVLALTTLFFTTKAQEVFPEKGKVPNYILRNNDFQDRRQTAEYVNFSKEYAEAFETVDVKQHAKATNSWIPRGPFGIGDEDLAGVGRINSMQFHPTDTNTWYICVAQGGVWKTTNAGESWTSLSSNLPILRTSYLAIHPTDPDIMYVALGDYAYLGHNLQANENKRNSHYGLGIYKTTNGGSSWEPTGLSFEQTDFEGSLIAKVFVNEKDPNTLLAVGQTGSYRSEDAGKNWTKTHSGLFWDMELDPTTDSVIHASTGYVHSYKIGSVSILKSTDFGQTWKESTVSIPKTGGIQRIELAVAPSDNNYIYGIACDTVGGFYGFYRSTNGGDSYTARIESKTYHTNILNHSLDDAPGGQGRYDLAITVDRFNRNKILIGGINMWQTTDGGLNFKPVTYWLLNYYKLSMHADIHEIRQHPTGTSYFACHDGGLSRSFDIIPDDVSKMTDEFEASTEWVNYTKGLNITSFYRLGINQDNGLEIMAGAQDNSTVYTQDSVFYNISGGDGMECVFYDKTFYRYTSSQNGRIYAYLSVDGGFNYQGVVQNNEPGEWTTPFVAANDELYVLYGNLFTVYADVVTKKITSFNDVLGTAYPRLGTALAVEKDKASHMYLAKRGYASQNIKNVIQASYNGGGSWSDIGNGLPDLMYPSYIEMNQSRPLEVWITFSGFDKDKKVFHSVDGGKNWDNITHNLPNIPVNCITHQNDGSDYVYIGTDLGVYLLKGDTTEWIYYSDGLPKVIVSELEVDTTHKTLVAATFGRGLWEVGLEYYENQKDGISDFKASNFDIQLSPNPVKDLLTITSTELLTEELNLTIRDITGRTVFTDKVDKGTTMTYQLNTANFAPGEYFIVLRNNTRMYAVDRFMKQ